MKTLVVLSAFVALAASAPRTPDNHNFRPQVHSYPVSSLRHRKSTLPENAAPVANEAADADDTFELKERTHKKKLIFKKTPGHLQLFQDSSEEKAQAESKELCTKEVKIKFCGDKHAAQTGKLNLNTIDIQPKPVSDSEVKQNIQLAKEVVESIQKMAQKLEKSDASDTELHEDIEIAKQALNHIQKNFDKLESLNLRVARFSEVDDLHKSHQGPSIFENERIVQRKRVQKSVDDSFKSSDNVHSTVTDIASPKILESASLVMHPDSEKDAKFENLQLKSNTIKDKSAGSGDLPTIKTAMKETIVPPSKKTSETMVSSDSLTSGVVMRDLLVEKNLPINTIDMKKSAVEGLQETHGVNNNNNNKIDETVVHSKTVEDLMPIMKSNDNDKTFKEVVASPKLEGEIIDKMIKAAKENELNPKNNQFTVESVDQAKDQPINTELMVPKGKNVEESTMQNFEPSNLHIQQKSWSPIMKTAGPEPHHGFHGAGISDSFHTQSHHHGISTSHHHLDHHHHLAHVHHGHPIFKASDMDGAQSIQMNVQEASEKSEIEPKIQWNPNHKAALEKNMRQWHHNHAGSARGAYGTGAYAGSGATSAVFPGSKNGPCAVPLLLSCSPNVVNGVLTSHSYGGAPAYKSEGSNLHHKRETKKPTRSQEKN